MTEWTIEYENDGNGHFAEWFSVGPAQVHFYGESDRGRAEEAARLIKAAPELLAFVQTWLETQPGPQYRQYISDRDLKRSALAIVAKTSTA